MITHYALSAPHLLPFIALQDKEEEQLKAAKPLDHTTGEQ